jgi:hypothetical protein
MIRLNHFFPVISSLLAMFRRGQTKKKTFTHGMTPHAASKGLANPS